MLGSLIAAFVSGEAVNAARRAKAAAIAYLLVAIFAATGVGFLIGAGYIAASRRLGDIEAALAFGVGFIAIALLILLVRAFTGSRRARQRERRQIDIAKIVGAATVTAIPLLLRSRAGTGALLGPLLGLVAYAIYRENRTGNHDDPERDDER